MKLIRGLYNLKLHHHRYGATIGNFDGMHLGHQNLLQRLLKKSRELQLTSLVITFEPSPQEYFLANKAPARLMTLREKLTYLAKFGIEQVLCLRFNADLANQSAETFVKTILVDRLNIRFLTVGKNFCFGYDRQGDITLLHQMGKQYGFDVQPSEIIFSDNKRIGSSRIRRLLNRGHFLLAKKLLGHPFCLSGRVVYGDQLGRTLGFPTANIFLHRLTLPLRGIFFVSVRGLKKQPLPALANIGGRPTIDDRNNVLEVYLLHFDEIIYGQFLQIEILKKLRDEIRFDSLDALKTQMQEDKKQAEFFFKL